MLSDEKIAEVAMKASEDWVLEGTSGGRQFAQWRAVAAAARREALEEAANAIDPKLRAYVMSWDALQCANSALESIRALIKEEQS